MSLNNSLSKKFPESRLVAKANDYDYDYEYRRLCMTGQYFVEANRMK